MTSLTATRDGTAVLVGTLDSTVRLLDQGSGQVLKSYRGHRNEELRVGSTLAARDRWVVSGSEEGEVVVWDLVGGEVVGRLKDAHGGRCCTVVVCREGGKGGGLWVSGGVNGEWFYI